jgi:putative PEP-CTERM system histidine kinase
MFSLYDLAEIGACFASFFTLLFVLVRRPGHVSGHLFSFATVASLAMWVAYILIVPRTITLLQWQQGVLIALFSVSGAFWLLFLLVFARESAFGGVRDRAFSVYILVALFAVAAVAAFFTPFIHLQSDLVSERFFLLTTLGKYFLVLLILSCTFGLFQLESTYRASVGQMRSALLKPVLATGVFLSVLLISAMIGLLYGRFEFAGIQLGALVSIAALVLLSRFLVFEEITGQRVVISREAVYSSVAVLLVGAYFVLIGVTVWFLVSIGGSPKVFFSVLAAFLAIVVFVALFFSSSIRARWRGLVDRSLYSGKLDLLTELSTFAEAVSAATDKREMFDVIATVLAQKCHMTDIVIALRSSRRGEFGFGYPTASLRTLALPAVEDWLFRAGRMMSKGEIQPFPGDCTEEERQLIHDELGDHFIPLMARKELVGFISCRTASGIGAEARFLIDSMSHQLALSLLSARQSEALLETRELASFSKVSSFVIHDVKNLISMLSMILQNAETKFGDPRFQQMTVDTLRGAQERMKRLIGRLTSPTKQTDVPLSDCDLRQLVLDLAEEMKLSGQRKISVNLDFAEFPPVRGDAERLRSVLSNLIINAIEAMPNGGELQIKGTADQVNAWIDVRDSGVGMTAEFVRDRLFRPFQTSKPSGLGIGLFQSRELVEQMGGELTVLSAVGEGTCFRMRLKRA